MLLAAVLAGATGVGATPGTTNTQDFTITAWQVEDGLPQSSVLSIAQTSEGYLWLATFGGLARFDGVRFQQFDASNLPGLPGNRLVRLFVDREDGLWLITEYNDLARLKDGVCRAYTTADGVPVGGIQWVGQDGNGTLWAAGAKGGLWRWHNDHLEPAPLPHDPAEPAPGGMVTDTAGRSWLRHRNALFRFEQGQAVPTPPSADGTSAEVLRVCSCRDGSLWAVTTRGLRKYRQNGWDADTWPIPDLNSVIVDMREDVGGAVWVATYRNGLFRFSPGREWEHFSAESGLTTRSMRSLYCDREGIIWVGTDGGGLLRLLAHPWKMITRRQGLGIDAVHSISQDQQGRIWFGGGTSTPYWLEGGVISAVLPDPESDVFRGVWAVLSARDGATWIGTYAGKVHRYRGGALTGFGQAEGMLAGSVRALLEDRQGAVWVGGFGGLCRIDRDQVAHYCRRDGMSSERVWALACDSSANLYIGTAGGGLNQLRDGKFTVYTREQGLPDNVVTALLVDEDDSVWIGTHGGGLSRFQAGRFFNYRVKGGLPARSIGPMLEDDQGRLWMASNLGIICVSRRELSEFAASHSHSINYVAFDRSDGLATVEVGGVQPGCLQARDGTLWFGTAKGAAFVDPKALRTNPLPPHVIIEEVRIDDDVVADRRSGASGPDSADARGALSTPASLRVSPAPSSVTVQPHQQRLEFRFTGLCFKAPTKVRFRYRMDPFDPEWVDGGMARSAFYTRLPPGTYRFRVTACNNDGVWNDADASLAVIIAPAFHQTWWFRLLVLAAVAAGVSAIYGIRLSRLKQLARLRGRIAGDLHDEIGSNIGGIILLSELAQRSSALPEETQASLRQINVTAQRSAGAIRDIVWFLNPDFDTLDDMVARMREFSAGLLTGVERTFSAPQSSSSQRLPLEFRRNVFFAFKEILHNVVKHARATRVDIELGWTGHRLTLRVRDDGRGFDVAAATSGHGLRSLQRRAKDLGGQVLLESQLTKGTTVVFEVILP